jgi:putative membrane protein
MLPRRRTMGWLIGGLMVIVVAVFAIAVLARLYWYPTMMPYAPGYGAWWFFPFVFPFGFLIFFIIVFALGRLLFWPWGWGWRRGYWYHHGGAEEILRERYARGEITKEQFDQMMRDLGQHP